MICATLLIEPGDGLRNEVCSDVASLRFVGRELLEATIYSTAGLTESTGREDGLHSHRV